MLRVCVSFNILPIPSGFKVFGRGLIYITFQKYSCSHLFWWIFKATLWYLGGETCSLQRPSASEAKHDSGGHAAHIKIKRYITLWNISLSVSFFETAPNLEDIIFNDWKACLSWKVQNEKRHISVESSLEPLHENEDKGYEWIPQRVTVRAFRVTIDMTSCSLRLHFSTFEEFFDEDLLGGFCDGVAYGSSSWWCWTMSTTF